MDSSSWRVSRAASSGSPASTARTTSAWASSPCRRSVPRSCGLHVEAVAVVREGKPLLSDITLTVRPGEHRALLGADGAGKATLLGLLGAQTHPTRGRGRSSAAVPVGWASANCARPSAM